MLVIDLTKKALEIVDYDLSESEHKQLSTYPTFYDMKCFEDAMQAEEFLSRYQNVLSGLDNSKICVSRDLPCMLYKRRYIVQTLMNLKDHTIRHYKKPWQPGQVFNLHDQNYFLSVCLKQISVPSVAPKTFRYDFKIYSATDDKISPSSKQ